MKITKIIEETKSISSNIKNAYIDFSKMTISLVAVCSDIKRNGKPLIGYGFNSNGRYGQGHLIRERFVPRLLETNPKEILNEEETNFDPIKMWDIMMKNEKPGGHGERSVAVGTIDMAIWDLVSKIERKPLFQVLAEKYGNGKANRKVFVYAAGGYYWPDQGIQGLTDEIKKISRSWLLCC
jgi:L-alanine-DL-glutamate epimerase-like enolase superfamily enzyme